MTDEYGQELRRIRITLIIMVVVFLISGGDTEVIYENDQNGNSQQYVESMISLGEGQFGVLSGDTSYSGGSMMTIYQYEPETNQLTKINEVYLDEMEYDE